MTAMTHMTQQSNNTPANALNKTQNNEPNNMTNHVPCTNNIPKIPKDTKQQSTSVGHRRLNQKTFLRTYQTNEKTNNIPNHTTINH